MEKWSIEKIWHWYNNRPWIRGCNYMSADCANRVDQWQALGFDERLETTDKELALAQSIGYNSIRIILEYAVWRAEYDTFYDRFDRYLDVCKKHGISCMVVLANDCMPPKSPDWKRPEVGEQTFDIGYHGGRKKSQHGIFPGMAPHFWLDDPEFEQSYYEMIKEFVTRYKDDERIILWDVYNEPGNSKRGEITLPKLKHIFKIIREINPSQPLTAGAWSFNLDNDVICSEVEMFALENSDIISYHCYGDYFTQVKLIKKLKEFGRPLINSEWLCRTTRNDVRDAFPLYYLENVGCYNWGLVAGKYQTFEPWECVWQWLEEDPETANRYDFTKWFHDLFRINHRPYDPNEIEIIKNFGALADKEFEKRK